MIIYLCTFLFALPQKEKIPKEKSQALKLRGYSEHIFAKRQKLASLKQSAVLHAKMHSPLYAPPLRRSHAALDRDVVRYVST